jgi:hypothetical protein
MASCITQDLRDVLFKMIDAKRDHSFMRMMVADYFPVCEEKAGGLAESIKEFEEGSGKTVVKEAKAASSRATGEGSKLWPTAIYFNESGEAKPYNSPSDLFKSLFPGVSPGKQIVCAVPEYAGQEPKCSPASMVQTFTLNGFIVRGNGEPPPAFTAAMTTAEKVAAHGAWKDKLKRESKHFVVYHPKAPQIKELGVA